LVPAWDRGFQAHALRREPTQADLLAGQQVQRFVEESGGPVLSEGAGFVLPTRGPVLGNPMLVRGLYAQGLYDGGGLQAALESRRVRGVILLGEWYPSPILQAIGNNYEVARRETVAGSVYKLLRPRAG
jgi:hypothetical protein